MWLYTQHVSDDDANIRVVATAVDGNVFMMAVAIPYGLIVT